MQWSLWQLARMPALTSYVADGAAPCVEETQAYRYRNCQKCDARQRESKSGEIVDLGS